MAGVNGTPSLHCMHFDAEYIYRPQESNAVLEDDAAFLADAGSHLAAVRAHAVRFAAESRAAVEAEARLHAVRCPALPCIHILNPKF